MKNVSAGSLKREIRLTVYPRLRDLGYTSSQLPTLYTEDPHARDLCNSYMGERWVKVTATSTYVLEFSFDHRHSCTFHAYGGRVPREGIISRGRRLFVDDVLVVQLASYYRLSSRWWSYAPFGLNGRAHDAFTTTRLLEPLLTNVTRLVDAMENERISAAFIHCTGRWSALWRVMTIGVSLVSAGSAPFLIRAFFSSQTAPIVDRMPLPDIALSVIAFVAAYVPLRLIRF